MKAAVSLLLATCVAAIGAAPVYTPLLAEASDAVQHVESSLDVGFPDNAEQAEEHEPEAHRKIAGWQDYMNQGISTGVAYATAGAGGEDSAGFEELAQSTEDAFDALNAGHPTPLPSDQPPTDLVGVASATTSLLNTMTSNVVGGVKDSLVETVQRLENEFKSTGEPTARMVEDSLHPRDAASPPTAVAPAAAILVTLISLSDAIYVALDDSLSDSLSDALSGASDSVSDDLAGTSLPDSVSDALSDTLRDSLSDSVSDALGDSFFSDPVPDSRSGATLSDFLALFV